MQKKNLLQKFKLKLMAWIYFHRCVVRWVDGEMDGKTFALSIVRNRSLRTKVLVQK